MAVQKRLRTAIGEVKREGLDVSEKPSCFLKDQYNKVT